MWCVANRGATDVGSGAIPPGRFTTAVTPNSVTAASAVTDVCRSGPLTDTVVTAVADAKGVDPLDVEPLHSAIDPDALDAIFQPRIGSPPTSLELTFTLDGCEVLVQADGEVVVTPPTAEAEERVTAAPANDE